MLKYVYVSVKADNDDFISPVTSPSIDKCIRKLVRYFDKICLSLDMSINILRYAKADSENLDRVFVASGISETT